MYYIIKSKLSGDSRGYSVDMAPSEAALDLDEEHEEIISSFPGFDSMWIEFERLTSPSSPSSPSSIKEVTS